MCGIVGLFLKNDEMRPQLGAMLTDMLITMTDRGPDSAGIAIYGSGGAGRMRMNIATSRQLVERARGNMRDALARLQRLRG